MTPLPTVESNHHEARMSYQRDIAQWSHLIEITFYHQLVSNSPLSFVILSG